MYSKFRMVSIVSLLLGLLLLEVGATIERIASKGRTEKLLELFESPPRQSLQDKDTIQQLQESLTAQRREIRSGFVQITVYLCLGALVLVRRAEKSGKQPLS